MLSKPVKGACSRCGNDHIVAASGSLVRVPIQSTPGILCDEAMRLGPCWACAGGITSVMSIESSLRCLRTVGSNIAIPTPSLPWVLSLLSGTITLPRPPFLP